MTGTIGISVVTGTFAIILFTLVLLISGRYLHYWRVLVVGIIIIIFVITIIISIIIGIIFVINVIFRLHGAPSSSALSLGCMGPHHHQHYIHHQCHNQHYLRHQYTVDSVVGILGRELSSILDPISIVADYNMNPLVETVISSSVIVIVISSSVIIMIIMIIIMIIMIYR